jgi:hypothetical protein
VRVRRQRRRTRDDCFWCHSMHPKLCTVYSLATLESCPNVALREVQRRGE